MEKLLEIAKEINILLEKKRLELSLTFIEETHTYYMLDLFGKIRSDYPSVSKLIDKFYNKFDEKAKSLQMCNGDVEKQTQLLAEWKAKGDFATNMGSRVHYMLETYLVSLYGNYKNVRQPIFVCNETQINVGNNMISAGKDYIKLMHDRGAVLLDTEIVLGSNILGYVGQPDKVWLMYNRDKSGFGLVITDWKTNQPKNFEVMPWTGYLFSPFNDYNDTALQHYYLQLPLYGKLLIDMLKGTKYENINLLGCVVVLLKDDSTYVEYKVPTYFNETILTMNLDKYLK